MTRTSVAVLAVDSAASTESDWRTSLPVLYARSVTLRELRLSDAPSLCALLSAEEVARFISPPPTTVEGFERFIVWAHRERAAGGYVCFAVVPDGLQHAIGVFQVRQLEGSFLVSEWGFALGSAFWGTGMFTQAAQEVLAFAFGTLGAHRMEARSSVTNGRGNGALGKLGATREALLRRSFLRNGVYHDQVLWSIVADEWWEWMNARPPASH